MSNTSATAFAPAGVGNVGVGFDVLGHTFQGPGDRVTVRRSRARGVRIVAIRGTTEDLPDDAAANTATAGLLTLVEEHALDFGFDVDIEKGIPLGSGMGGSAASAVAAVVAANALLDEPLDANALFRYALIGEMVASGSAHGDNLGAGLLGGLVLVQAIAPPRLVRIPVPQALRCVLVHPHLRVDTRTARGVLARDVALAAHVEQSANLAAVIAGCFSADVALIGAALRDVIVEPARKALVPGFDDVQRAAMSEGALGCTLSGAGPSMFAWCAGDDVAERVRRAMTRAFEAGGVACEAWTSPVDGPGAHLIDLQ